MTTTTTTTTTLVDEASASIPKLRHRTLSGYCLTSKEVCALPWARSPPSHRRPKPKPKEDGGGKDATPAKPPCRLAALRALRASAPVCRICLDEGDAGDNSMIAPCECICVVHRECLKEWMAQGRTHCEVCTKKYRLLPSERPAVEKRPLLDPSSDQYDADAIALDIEWSQRQTPILSTRVMVMIMLWLVACVLGVIIYMALRDNSGGVYCDPTQSSCGEKPVAMTGMHGMQRNLLSYGSADPVIP